jgi:hypothetical protein
MELVYSFSVYAAEWNGLSSDCIIIGSSSAAIASFGWPIICVAVALTVVGRSRDVSKKVRRGRIDINDVLLLLLVHLLTSFRQASPPPQKNLDDLWIGVNDSDMVKAAKSISISSADIIIVIIIFSRKSEK